jgi:PAS domain-containing protein
MCRLDASAGSFLLLRRLPMSRTDCAQATDRLDLPGLSMSFKSGNTEIENRFELLVQSVTDYAIYMLDREGIVTTWNAGARRFKGYEAEAIVGKQVSLF